MKPESTVMSTEPKRLPGRPRLPDSVRKTLVLDRQTIAKAEALGGGNLSLGLRMAVASLSASAGADPLPATHAV